MLFIVTIALQLVIVTIVFVFTCSVATADAATPLVQAGAFTRLYDTNKLSGNADWYINDHTLVLGHGDTWHLFGITHTESADPMMEANSAHATFVAPAAMSARINTTDAFQQEPFAFGSEKPFETQFWAPHVIIVNGMYYMFYCGGGNDRTKYMINLAVSNDYGYHWNRVGTLFTGGIDGRDPMVMNLGPQYDNKWIIYYVGTTPNDLIAPSVEHVTYYRTSDDLRNWSPEGIAFNGGSDGQIYGGPTESPFVVRRGNSFYLFTGTWVGYSDTRVFVSTNPFDFGSIPAGTAIQVGEIASHAPEVVRDRDGQWYITRAGWGQAGVYIAPLTWFDGLDDQSTSMPEPASSDMAPPNFLTNLHALKPVPYGNGCGALGTPAGYGGIWHTIPMGMAAGCAMGDGFMVSDDTIKSGQSFMYQGDVMLLTYDGNPTSQPSNLTRIGTSVSLLFFANTSSPSYPTGSGRSLLPSYAVNMYTDHNGGIALCRFDSTSFIHIISNTTAVTTNVWYNIKMQYIADKPPAIGGGTISVWFGRKGQPAQQVISDYHDASLSGGSFGLNVWQGSAVLQTVLYYPL